VLVFIKIHTKIAALYVSEWSVESTGVAVDLQTISPEDLSKKMKQFYCDARPSASKTPPKQRPKTAPGPKTTDGLYHKSTLINIRAAINRKLADLQRNIDVVRDKVFKTANGALDGLLKERMRSGMSKSVQHKPPIELTDLVKINTYLKLAPTSPVVLRHAVWFNLAVHFVSRGLEFHHQLTLNSFDFQRDDSGEFVTLGRETQQKNYQGSLGGGEGSSGRRMYATGLDNCPVRNLQMLIEKTDKDATHLFNQYRREIVAAPSTYGRWYTDKELSKRSFGNFMANISKAAGVTTHYTAVHTPFASQ
jgi:hypothetical protein